MPTQQGGYYTKDGIRVPSVTTIISNVKLGGIEPLLAWANREGLAGRNHRDTRDKAADAGTCAHDMVECDVHGWAFDATKYAQETVEAATGAFRAYQSWKQQSKVEIVATETPLVSDLYQFGGTLDAIGVIDGDHCLIDWKTSNHVYGDYLIQIAAYAHLWMENGGEVIRGFHLLRFNKQQEPGDPVSFTHHYWSDLTDAWEAFLDMRRVYKRWQKIKRLV